jgi:hypothetical protein
MVHGLPSKLHLRSSMKAEKSLCSLTYMAPRQVSDNISPQNISGWEGWMRSASFRILIADISRSPTGLGWCSLSVLNFSSYSLPLSCADPHWLYLPSATKSTFLPCLISPSYWLCSYLPPGLPTTRISAPLLPPSITGRTAMVTFFLMFNNYIVLIWNTYAAWVPFIFCLHFPFLSFTWNISSPQKLKKMKRRDTSICQLITCSKTYKHMFLKLQTLWHFPPR